MFQFPSYSLRRLWIHLRISGYLHRIGCPIRTSADPDMCSSPRLFAACHVLLRLMVPRHPPCALCNLTYLFSLRLLPTHLESPITSVQLLLTVLFLFQITLFVSSYAVFKVLALMLTQFSSLLVATKPSMVETTRLELVTSCLQSRRSPS